MTRLRYTMFAVTVLLVLALSAMSTVPALADDTPPPPTETPTVETPPSEEVIEPAPPAVEELPPTEALAVEETIPAESAPVEETAPVEEPAPLEETTAEVLASVPEGTEVVVVNEEGETIPLVTQEAADAIEFIDPVWCPVGVAPQDGTGGCTTSYTSLKLLVDALMAGTAFPVPATPATNGVIWIELGTDASTGAILLDGSDVNLGSMETFSLTLKGGWNGTFGNTAITGTSTFTQSISIIHWLGDITLTDITVSGVTVTPGIASNNAALNVETSKKIILTNVKVNSNNDPGAEIVNGAWLDNDEGTVVSDVSITNSEFKNNEYVGLTVNSDGVITLAGVLANGNLGGATLDNSTAATAKAVTIITGANEFSNNGFGGLNILSKGVITLKDITANNNGGDGMTLDNTYGTFVSGITFTGTTIASDNGDEGIEAFSDGAITASNLVANSNLGYGAYFDNDLAATALGVTISGSSNQFKFNSSAGLIINSYGAILLNSISANSNGAEGAVLDNDGFSGGLANVTLTGTNSFRENFSYGLFIVSDGVVTLSNITANDNGIGASAGVGVSVDNDEASTPKAVTLTGVNEFVNNYDGGLYVVSDGAITVSKLTATFSQSGHGVYLENNHNSLIPQNVTVSGYANVSNNSGGSGMIIFTFGVVSLTNVTANDNSGNGLYVDNYSSSSLPKAVSISGINNFNGNGSAGLDVYSLGAITLSNATASDNVSSYGAYLSNNYALAVGGITLTATSGTWNEFARNGSSGIVIYSKGNITLPITDAFENGSYGVYLDNNEPGATGNVSVGLVAAGLCSYQSDNFYSGLEVYTNGTVTLASICNFDNGFAYGYGAYIDNTTAVTPKAVTLLGENDFTGNFNSGLNIITKGAVVLNKVAANDNGGFGAFVDNNTNNLVPQNVTLNGYGDFIGNGDDGLQIATYGLVTLASLYADGNNGDGIYVDNFTGADVTKPKAVTINGYSESFNNTDYGLFIHTLGAIKINNLIADNNNIGASLDNNDSATISAVTVTGHAWTGNNTTNGLLITTKGSITIANLAAWGNGTHGAILDNAFPGATGLVTLTGYAEAGNNSGDGLLVNSNRAITITNLYAEGNGLAGVTLNNTFSGTGSPQPVTIIGRGQFYGNGDDGLDIFSYGAITTNNLTANDNGQNAGAEGWGVYLDNHTGATTAKPVTLNGTNTFNGNFQDGLYVESLGLIKANNLTAILNSGDGVYLDNQWSFGTFGVTLTGSNLFESNGGDGLIIYSNGAVTASNVSANWNFGNGAYIDTYNDFVPVSKVTLTGNNTFLGNGDGVTGGGQDGTGLYVRSDYVITINNLTANWNTEEGAHLYGYDDFALAWFAPISLKLTGVNTFNGNGTDGLFFYSPGNVDITKITADGNGGDGVDGYSEFESITITCGSMTNNTGYGWRLQLDSVGELLTLKGVFATGNTAGNTFQTGGTLVTVRACPLP